MLNKQIILRKRPVGFPDEETWSIEESAVPELQEGQMLVEQYYISMDPAMRGWMNNAKSYLPPIQIGDVMRAGSVGKVISSSHKTYQVGDYVYGTGGVQQYVVAEGRGWHKVDPELPLPVYISTLGMTGLTAYFGILDIGKIKVGETVLISGAAGAVGSVAGQIAKLKGCQVVGIAGGPQKCNYIKTELGFDAAIDYKNENLYQALNQYCPKGIDVYFDNVGGDILDAALARIRRYGRVVLCGAISQYNSTQAIQGPSNYLSLLINRGRMEGFIILDYVDRFNQGILEMAQWMKEGKIKSREHVIEGIENFYDAFTKLFSGEKLGKLVLQVGKEQS